MNIRRYVVWVVTICLLLTTTGSAFGAPNLYFHDMKGSFAEQAVTQLAKQGIIQGLNSELFGPKENISRLHFTVLIAKALGVQPLFPYTPTFTDLSKGSVETGYVEAMTKLGVVTGRGNGTFDGTKPVKRQEAAVMIRKTLDLNNTKLPFPKDYLDLNSIYPYATESVAYVTYKGIMSGTGDYLYPLKNLTRAEAAMVAYQLMNLRNSQGAATGSHPTQTQELKTGETTKIEVGTTNQAVPLSTVFGFEGPGVSNVLPDGTVITGDQAGKSTVTVNKGNVSYPVQLDLYSSIKETTDPFEPIQIPGLGHELNPTYRVVQQQPDPAFKKAEYTAHGGPVDGLISKSDAWTGFLRQQGRDVIIDLKNLNAVSSISLEFRQENTSGITLPKYIQGAVSVDGTAWYQLGRAYHSVSPSDNTPRNVTLSISFPAIKARYLKLSFPVDTWVFARHLTVRSNYPGDQPVVLNPITYDSNSAGNYLFDPNFKDILLLYTGDKSEQQTITQNDFLPLVAYIDRQGLIGGRMFDSMLFLPKRGLPCTKASWLDYANDLFTPGQQLFALDQAMEKMNSFRGTQDKEKIILALPYPDSKQKDFGTLYLNGKPLSFLASDNAQKSVENRFAAVQWYYNMIMDKWNQAGFKNLEIGGFYWDSEAVDQTITGEADLIKKVSAMTTGQGQNLFWIPFYGAKGYKDWQQFGFTHVFLQPNYYAEKEVSEDRVERAAELAKQYGAGIELECDSRMLNSKYFYDLFYKELKKAHEAGLDGDTPTAYYIGLKDTLLQTQSSNVPQVRGVYEDLYKWISGTYK